MPYRPILLGFLLGFAACGSPLLDSGEEESGPEITPASPTLHRLTKAEYQRTLGSLFGDTIAVPQDLEADTLLQGYRSIGASALTISPHAAEQFEAAALSVAQQVFSDAGRRASLLSCAPQSGRDPCIRDFLSRFGLRAFRRPLSPAELTQFSDLSATLADSFKSPLLGVEYTVAAMLESPHFLFRVERGEPDPDRPGRLRYTSYEMASRLSYLLSGTMPDDELLAAAERGELANKATMVQHAERLLHAPQARAAIVGFFAEYFSLDRLDLVSKDHTLFPQFGPALSQAMRGEVEQVVADLVFEKDGDFRQIFDSRETLLNADLAKLYGLPVPVNAPQGPGFSRVTLPEGGLRGGLLGMAAILTQFSHAAMTSPTLRGKFIRQQLLCQDIPPPPPGVVINLDPGMGQPTTLRERLAAHRTNPSCAGCHNLMDPLGLGLENFDPIGALRDKDNGLPIDATSDLNGTPFTGPRELGSLIRNQAGIGTCLARQFYRHANGHLEEVPEQDGITFLGERFATTYRISDLVLLLIKSDGFRYASPPDQAAQAGSTGGGA